MERMPVRARGSALKGAYVFALIACFAVLALLIVLVGAKVYRSIAHASEQNYESRTALSYVVNKVRGADAAGMVSAEALDGVNALVLGAVYGGERYNTAIYLDGGYLSECFYRADRGFSRELGDQLVAVGGLDIKMDGNLVTVEITDTDGAAHALSVYVQSVREAAE